MSSHALFSSLLKLNCRPLKLNDDEILYASISSTNFHYNYCKPFLVVMNVEKGEVTQLVRYPTGFRLVDCNLAYDAERKNVYLLQHECGGPDNLYKINLDSGKWQLIYEGLQEDIKIHSTPNSDSIGLFIRNHTIFLIAPIDSGNYDDAYRWYSFDVYKFDERQKNKIQYIGPKKSKYYREDKVFHTLIIPKSNDDTKTEFLILNQQLSISSIKEISLTDGIVKETVNEESIAHDVETSYIIEFDAKNGAQAIRGDKILIFNATSDEGDYFINIIDIKSRMKIRQSHISCPCGGDYHAVLIENVQKEKKLTHHWIRNETKNASLSIPWYISDIVTSYYCNDKIIMIAGKPLMISIFLWIEIPIDDILDQDQETAQSKKYKWTYSKNKFLTSI